MDAETAQPPTTSVSSSSSSSSSTFPRWVMFEECRRHDDDDSTAAAADDDPTTMASARTSNGDVIQFSLHIQDPLAAPTVRIPQVRDGGGGVMIYYAVVATHGDSLLIHVERKQKRYPYSYTDDYFVYNAGDAAAARPPSLCLLPPCSVTEEEGEKKPVGHHLLPQNLGLLRRRSGGGGNDDDGGGELVVAELTTAREIPELRMFRSSTGEWSFKRVPISYSDSGFTDDDDDDGQVFCWEHYHTSIWTAVVPVGDGRLLCWVHLSRGVMVICDDVFEERPRLRLRRLPMDPCLSLGLPSNQNRNVCATVTADDDGGGDALKFVNVFPRCCCGGAGATDCERSCHAYTIFTWTMRIVVGNGGGDMDELEWVKDGMIDCAELWGLEAYKGLPFVPLDHPVVSLDEPHVIYFQLSERHHVKGRHDTPLWLVKVDVRSKAIRSVSRYEDGFRYIGVILIPSNVSYFFNSYHHPPSDDGTLITGQRRQAGIERRTPVVVADEQKVGDDDVRKKPTLQPASSSSAEPSDEQASEFFETLLEISRYGFDGDDELKAYRILSRDNGRRFRSLLKLPKDLRKDWLLLEIKQG